MTTWWSHICINSRKQYNPSWLQTLCQPCKRHSWNRISCRSSALLSHNSIWRRVINLMRCFRVRILCSLVLVIERQEVGQTSSTFTNHLKPQSHIFPPKSLKLTVGARKILVNRSSYSQEIRDNLISHSPPPNFKYSSGRFWLSSKTKLLKAKVLELKEKSTAVKNIFRCSWALIVKKWWRSQRPLSFQRDWSCRSKKTSNLSKSSESSSSPTTTHHRSKELLWSIPSTNAILKQYLRIHRVRFLKLKWCNYP